MREENLIMIKKQKKVIRQNHINDGSTDDKDPNMDIFKSDSFAESLTKNLKEGQPKKIQDGYLSCSKMIV